MKQFLFLISFLISLFSWGQTINSVTYDNSSFCNGDLKSFYVVVEDIGSEVLSVNNNSDNGFLDIYTPVVDSTVGPLTYIKVDVENDYTISNNSFENESFTLTLAPSGVTYDITNLIAYGDVLPTIDFTGVPFCANGLPFDLSQYGSPLGGVFDWGSDEYTSYFDPAIYNEMLNGEEGNISYTYINQDGCIGSTEFSVEILAPPSVTVQTAASSCGEATGGVTATLPVSDPVDVYWSTGLSATGITATSAISNLSSGTYYVNVTDLNGCKSVGTAHVSDGDMTVSEVIDGESCPGFSDGLIDLTVGMPAGSSTMTTFWSNGATTEDMSGQPGEYSVEMHTDNNCNFFGTYEIPENDIKIDVDNIAQAYGCGPGANPGQINISTSGGTSPYSWSWTKQGDAGWSDPMTEDIASESGVYTCTVTDDNSCSLTWSATIPAVVGIDVSTTTVTKADCGESNGSVNVTINSGTSTFWEWSNGATTEDLANVSASAHTLEYHDNSPNQCEAFLTVAVPNNRPYQPQICLLTVDTSLVYNQIIWEKDPNNVVDGFNIYRETTNYGEFELVASVPYENESVYIDNAASPISRSWRYYLTTYDECQESYPSFIHKTIHIVVESTNGTDYNLAWDDYEGITYTSIDLKRYDPIADLWEVLANLPAGTNSYTDTPTGILNPEYLISFNLTDPCTSSKVQDHNSSRSNNTSSVFNPGEDTDVSIIENENGRIAIYPNPIQDNLNVFVENADKFEMIQIIDVNGEIIYNQVVNESYNMVNTSYMAAGIYFVQIYSDNEVLIRKIVKH
jgi:hypothetical protein